MERYIGKEQRKKVQLEFLNLLKNGELKKDKVTFLKFKFKFAAKCDMLIRENNISTFPIMIFNPKEVSVGNFYEILEHLEVQLNLDKAIKTFEVLLGAKVSYEPHDIFRE